LSYSISDLSEFRKLSFMGNFALKSVVQCIDYLCNIHGISYSLSMLHIIFLFMESNAFSKSINVIYRMACHSTLCSSIILKVFIKSMQLRCLRKPPCSFRRCCSTVYCILFKITLVRILLGILKRVIALQLLQFDRSPFFSILIISPFHSSGIFSSFHIFCNRGYCISTVISGSTFNTSGFILPRPAAFLFVNYVRASHISVFVGESKFTSLSF